MSLECGTIFTREQDLREGLFGGVFLFMLEVLPLLHERGIRPHWRIDTACYGNVVPDVLEPGRDYELSCDFRDAMVRLPLAGERGPQRALLQPAA